MTRSTAVIVTALLWQATVWAAPEPPAIAECQKAELLGYAPTDEQIESHRQVALPPLEEEVAMLLLDAGTYVSLLSDERNSFRQFAEMNHWQRVIAWLDAHEE